MSFNLPDDWGGHYESCLACGGTYHASGTVECGCEVCGKCESLTAPSAMGEKGVCQKCIDGDNLSSCWVTVMREVILELNVGVPVFLLADSDQTGEVLEMLDGSRVLWDCNGQDRISPSIDLRVDLDEKQGWAWAGCIALCQEAIDPTDVFWMAALDRHWPADSNTDKDRLELARALAMKSREEEVEPTVPPGSLDHRGRP